MYYAGIGSRETPDAILKLMRATGRYLGREGYTLRSGASIGADKAFERGCDDVAGRKEIYLPWEGFMESRSMFIVSSNKAFQLAEQFHPYWHNLSDGSKKIQACTSHQIFGRDLKTPADFVLCYTDKGSGAGSTGLAIRIANAFNIPVFDIGKYDNLQDLRIEFSLFLHKNMKKKDKIR